MSQQRQVTKLAESLVPGSLVLVESLAEVSQMIFEVERLGRLPPRNTLPPRGGASILAYQPIKSGIDPRVHGFTGRIFFTSQFTESLPDADYKVLLDWLASRPKDFILAEASQ